MESLDGISLYIIFVVIVLLMMGISTPMPRANKSRNTSKFKQKLPKKIIHES